MDLRSVKVVLKVKWYYNCCRTVINHCLSSFMQVMHRGYLIYIICCMTLSSFLVEITPTVSMISSWQWRKKMHILLDTLSKATCKPDDTQKKCTHDGHEVILLMSLAPSWDWIHCMQSEIMSTVAARDKIYYTCFVIAVGSHLVKDIVLLSLQHLYWKSFGFSRHVHTGKLILQKLASRGWTLRFLSSELSQGFTFWFFSDFKWAPSGSGEQTSREQQQFWNLSFNSTYGLDGWILWWGYLYFPSFHLRSPWGDTKLMTLS